MDPVPIIQRKRRSLAKKASCWSNVTTPTCPEKAVDSTTPSRDQRLGTTDAGCLGTKLGPPGVISKHGDVHTSRDANEREKIRLLLDSNPSPWSRVLIIHVQSTEQYSLWTQGGAILFTHVKVTTKPIFMLMLNANCSPSRQYSTSTQRPLTPIFM